MRCVRCLCGVLLATSGCAYVFPVSATGKGCSGESAAYFPAVDVVRILAAEALSCPAGELVVEPSGETTVRASGCGASRDYACEDDAVSGCSLEDAAAREGCRPQLE